MKSTTLPLIILCLLILIGTTGCMENFLDRSPFGSVDGTTFFTKKEHADLAAIAGYSTLLKFNNHWADAQLELGMSDDFSPNGLADASPFYEATFSPSEGNVVNGMWKRGFSAIAQVSKSIERIEGMDSSIISDQDRAKYLSELKFIRAFWYFRLIRFYGDLPLRASAVEDPTDDVQVMMPLTPKEDLLSKLVIPDLIAASQNLPERWPDEYYNRATKGAALATLVEVYVYTKQYQEAIAAGKQVETLGYSLLDDPNNVLRVDYEGNPELIFSVGHGQPAGTYREFYYGTTEDIKDKGRIMRGDTYSGDYFYPSRDLVGSFEMIDGTSPETSPLYDPSASWKYRDPRFDVTFYTPMDELTTSKGVSLMWDASLLVNKETGYDIQKRGIYYGENNWNFRKDFVLIRLPRVYLLMAEAYALQSSPDYASASTYIEKVRSRARRYALAHPDKYIPEGLSADQVLPPHRIASREEALAALDYENRVELFTEDCYRYYDLKRWDTLKVKWPMVGNFVWNDKFANLPYPSSETNINKNIQQTW